MTSKLVYIYLSLLLIAFSCNGADRDEANTQPYSMLLSSDFKAAADVIRDNFLFFDPNNPVNIKDAASMGKYLHYSDRSSEYLDKFEYESFRRSQKKMYVGIGMEIEKNDAGEIICLPFPNSPASNAGIKTGDVLKSVQGQNILTSTILSVAGKIFGEEGTSVRIGIIDKLGHEKNLTIERQQIKYNSVTKSTPHGAPIINICSFNASTRRELKLLLLDLDKSPVIIIDLRDNPGGDFYAAVDSAMLFLEKDELVATIEKKKEVHHYESTTSPMIKNKKIIIWQNENTASAAEVFTAALVENNIAVSIGKTSYGKGTSQRIFELSDGSALILTIGYILTPSQKRYHDVGLYPTYEIKIESPSTEAYLKLTESVLSRASSIHNYNY